VPTIIEIKPYRGKSDTGCQITVEKKSLRLASFLTSGLVNTGKASRKTKTKMRITPKIAKKEERNMIFSIMNSDRRNLFFKLIASVLFSMVWRWLIFEIGNSLFPLLPLSPPLHEMLKIPSEAGERGIWG
jgi:hypothetical protein